MCHLELQPRSAKGDEPLHKPYGSVRVKVSARVKVRVRVRVGVRVRSRGLEKATIVITIPQASHGSIDC